jgi:hypothetical protein
MLPRIGSRTDRLGLHEVVAGVLGELTDDLDFDSRLLERLAPGGCVYRLARLDSPSRDDSVDPKVTEDVEDEQLVDARLGMLACDVHDNRWSAPHRPSAIRSATAMVLKCVFARGIVGMTEASAT